MADYDSTQRALAGFVTSGGQLRAVGIAAWGLVFAQALQSHSWTVSTVAVGVAVAFAVADGYYSTLYRQTLRRAREIEILLGEYHNALGIHALSDRKHARAIADLQQHRFGVHRQMQPVNKRIQRVGEPAKPGCLPASPRSRPSYWWIPRPYRVTWIYAVLIVVSAAFAIGFSEHRQRNCQVGNRTAEPCIVFTTGTPPPAATAPSRTTAVP